ncbi:MAG: transposase [Campylobacterales bacterium]
MKYRLKSTRHVKYLLHAHLVFTPKYRKRIFTQGHLETIKEIFENLCKKIV